MSNSDDIICSLLYRIATAMERMAVANDARLEMDVAESKARQELQRVATEGWKQSIERYAMVPVAPAEKEE